MSSSSLDVNLCHFSTAIGKPASDFNILKIWGEVLIFTLSKVFVCMYDLSMQIRCMSLVKVYNYKKPRYVVICFDVRVHIQFSDNSLFINMLSWTNKCKNLLGSYFYVAYMKLRILATHSTLKCKINGCIQFHR